MYGKQYHVMIKVGKTQDTHFMVYPGFVHSLEFLEYTGI